jgi:hypothetical protein
MCKVHTGCERPEELKGKPEECTPEQIRQCHGETLAHPCLSQEKKSQQPP